MLAKMGKESKSSIRKILLKKVKNVELSGDLRKVLGITRSVQGYCRRKNDNVY